MGSHNCLYYESQENLLEFVSYFFKQGLNTNESCVWAVPQSLGVEGAKAALSERIGDLDKYIEKGQFELLSHNDSYLRSGTFNPDDTLVFWSKKERDALKKGFSGFRASGDASWVQEEDWDRLVAYETAVDKLVSRANIAALCTYPIKDLDIAKMFSLSLSHRYVIRNKDGKVDILTRHQ
ncbi:MAG: MEDS domain-containing protein [Candidatus Omnitrophica bacterium]|nr:MEDS domain-containing protein [Candidatus Omnitrophota bacterium]